jgi:mRNA interferase MazF
MKAYEIPIKVTREGRIELLDALLELLPREQVVRVIILIPEPTDIEEQAVWSRLTEEQFFAGYSEADSIYDRIWAMQDYRPGEIVLLSFPFADATEVKRRPALVLLDTGDEDIVVSRVTSQVAQGPFDVEFAEWRKAGLLLPSVARVHKVATLEKRLVERRLGALTASDWAQVRAVIQQLWTSI